MEPSQVSDELLVGYWLNALDDDATRQVEESLSAEPTVRDRLVRLRRLLSPLACDQEWPEPPADLVARTIGRVAEHICREGALQPSSEPAAGPNTLSRERLHALAALADAPAASSGRWRRPDFVVAASILFLATALGMASLPTLYHRYQISRCANGLREMHVALTTYADAHNGDYPKIREQAPYDTAESFVQVLRGAGIINANLRTSCPAQAGSGPTLPYAYSLGYRDGDGRLVGLRADEEQRDYLPIMADRPSVIVGDGFVSRGNNPDHRTGQNVLYLGGGVRFVTSPLVGVGGDDIYLNNYGQVLAGVDRTDSVLGVGADHP